MSYSTIIFDLDGTLLDTLGGIAESVNAALKTCDLPGHKTNSFKRFLGNGLYSLVSQATPPHTDKKTIDSCCTRFKQIYSQNWMNNCCVYPGIDDMLFKLFEKDINLAVLSNKPHQFTQLFVEEFLPKNMFFTVLGQRDGYDKKPHPAVAVELVKKLGVLPQNTLFVGDSDVDMQTGNAAGMGTAGVSWGYREVEELIENEADVIANSPLEIVEYVFSTS